MRRRSRRKSNKQSRLSCRRAIKRTFCDYLLLFNKQTRRVVVPFFIKNSQAATTLQFQVAETRRRYIEDPFYPSLSHATSFWPVSLSRNPFSFPFLSAAVCTLHPLTTSLGRFTSRSISGVRLRNMSKLARYLEKFFFSTNPKA